MADTDRRPDRRVVVMLKLLQGLFLTLLLLPEQTVSIKPMKSGRKNYRKMEGGGLRVSDKQTILSNREFAVTDAFKSLWAIVAVAFGHYGPQPRSLRPRYKCNLLFRYCCFVVFA
ncbi:hypothetical protein E2C01_048924 [Portunus trituberculatus]|uniref:Uncharacterized protein n=1 Tax=Portunus trituberculatus TaxID=210409 RepID=A0A5B7GCJ3_PORTR|nr:hypothetical protein [Portunus trituberculatus]